MGATDKSDAFVMFYALMEKCYYKKFSQNIAAYNTGNEWVKQKSKLKNDLTEKQNKKDELEKEIQTKSWLFKLRKRSEYERLESEVNFLETRLARFKHTHDKWDQIYTCHIMSFLNGGLQPNRIGGKKIKLSKRENELFCLTVWDNHISQLVS